MFCLDRIIDKKRNFFKLRKCMYISYSNKCICMFILLISIKKYYFFDFGEF